MVREGFDSDIVTRTHMDNVGRVMGQIADNAQELQSGGLPVDDRMRIDSNLFIKSDTYARSVVDRDNTYILKRLQSAHPGKGLEEIRDNEHETIGYQAEVLINELLRKGLSDRYLVVRTAEYDDWKQGVDMLVIDKKSGEIVIGLDASDNKEAYKKRGDEANDLLQVKKGKVERRNLAGGFEIKYGISIKHRDLDKPVVEYGHASNIAVFVPSLISDLVIAGYRIVAPFAEGLNDEEDKYVRLFLSQIITQIRQLKQIASYDRLPEKTRKGVEVMERYILDRGLTGIE